jgi:hypothetical protein
MPAVVPADSTRVLAKPSQYREPRWRAGPAMGDFWQQLPTFRREKLPLLWGAFSPEK